MSKKRSHGEGTIRQRDGGRWEGTLMIGYQSDGRRKYKTFYGRTQAEVKKKMREFQVAKENGELSGMEYNFSDWADIWYENHRDNIKPTTQENYRYTLRILKDHFGRRKIMEIKAMDIEIFLKKLRRDGRSDSCLSQCRGMLFQIFNKAEANDLVRKNPVRFAEKMRKRPAKRKEAFTAEEVKLLLENLPEDQVGWGIRLMLCTGMRTQELLGLEPRHIAEDGSYIIIEQAVSPRIVIGRFRFPRAFATVPDFSGMFLRSIAGSAASPTCPAILLTSAKNSKKKFPQLKV